MHGWCDHANARCACTTIQVPYYRGFKRSWRLSGDTEILWSRRARSEVNRMLPEAVAFGAMLYVSQIHAIASRAAARQLPRDGRGIGANSPSPGKRPFTQTAALITSSPQHPQWIPHPLNMAAALNTNVGVTRTSTKKNYQDIYTWPDPSDGVPLMTGPAYAATCGVAGGVHGHCCEE